MDKNKTVWAFDLGKGSIGEAVRRISDNKFLHKESLLIQAELRERKRGCESPVWKSSSMPCGISGLALPNH